MTDYDKIEWKDMRNGIMGNIYGILPEAPLPVVAIYQPNENASGEWEAWLRPMREHRNCKSLDEAKNWSIKRLRVVVESYGLQIA